jgi:FixJ family two-component response regulator
MKMRGFILDDSAIVLKTLTAMIKRHGHEVITFTSAQQFCLLRTNGHLCPDNQVCGDFLLTDVNMPGVSGIELVLDLRARGCHIPNVGIISGEWHDADLLTAWNLGCRTFEKPVSVGDLDGWLESCAGNVKPKRTLTNCYYLKSLIETPLGRSVPAPPAVSSATARAL